MINTLAQTIVWIAKERMKVEHFQNLNSAIHAVSLEVALKLIEDYMKEGK